MGLLDKMKNLFTEEVDEPVRKEKKPVKKEEPIKKEIFKQERSVEIAPARKETADLYDTDIEEIKEIKKEPETKAMSSLYFDDDDFLDLPKKEEKKEVKPTSLARDIYSEISETKKVEPKPTPKYEPKYEPKLEPKFEPKFEKKETKKFKPSPIISPVYGILDKNYKKDEIPSKVRENPYKSDKLTVDDVRKKAYGTLEDELENTLTGSLIINEEKNDPGIDIFDELETRTEKNKTEELSAELEKQKQQIDEINEIIRTNVNQDKKKITSTKIDNILEELDELEDLIPAKSKAEKNDNIEVETKVTEEIKVVKKAEKNDDLEEGDLFNLIDSMYEKRDDE